MKIGEFEYSNMFVTVENNSLLNWLRCQFERIMKQKHREKRNIKKRNSTR